MVSLRVFSLLPGQVWFGVYGNFRSTAGRWYVCLHFRPWYIELSRRRPR